MFISKNRRVTIRDVAKDANVSVTTVSFVINGNVKEVSNQTAKRVRDSVERLGYVPNAHAQNLVKRKTGFIALVIPDITNPFYTKFANAIIEELAKSDYTLAILSRKDNSENLDHIKKVLTNASFDGGIIVSKIFTQADFEEISQHAMPFVLLDEYINDDEIPMVVSDNYLGGRLAAQHFLDMNHRRLACITGPSNSPNSRLRLEGFSDVLAEVGLTLEATSQGDYSFESGYLAAKRLLAKVPDVTGIFCLNDVMAMGAVRALHERNLRVPEDISIIGYDNIAKISELSISMTTIDQNINEMGYQVVKLLCESLQEKAVSPKRYIIKPSLKIGKSVQQLEA